MHWRETQIGCNPCPVSSALSGVPPLFLVDEKGGPHGDRARVWPLVCRCQRSQALSVNIFSTCRI